MDTNALKKFAQAARNLLIEQVASKLDVVLAEGSAARREAPKAIKDVEAAINKANKQQVIEQVAYTWFNRFTALRFMDANGYTQVRTVSPADGATRPELLSEAMAGNLPDKAPATIQSLLDGRTPSHDPQAEAYRLLLVHTCNQWHAPMPFLFEEIDDYTELLMPEDLLSQTSILAELRKVMTEDACQDVEIIGWLYQFYISEKKDQVFAGLKKNQKITAENIPAATQLFTPHWIVRYLVENSLGRLWLLNRPQSRLAERMDYYIAPEEPETDFLKITKPEEIRICDPAAGSGHMLTYAFDLLYAIYEEEGYDPTEIPALILTNNLTGVEIDDRAGALAAFALAMKAAAKLGRRRFLRMEVKPDICVLQNVSFTDAEMQDVAAVVGKDLFTDELRETCAQFEQAKNFGSLIVPKLRDPAETLRVVEARDFGGDLLLKEVQERVVAVLRMAEALSPKYHVVVANPPYMGGKGMNTTLSKFLLRNYEVGKNDLMTAFILRCTALSRAKSHVAAVTLDSWMFLSTFKHFRKELLHRAGISSMLHVGWNCFPDGHVYNRGVALTLQKGSPQIVGQYLNLSDVPATVDKNGYFKEKTRQDGAFIEKVSAEFSKLPGQPIAYFLSDQVLALYDRGTLGGQYDISNCIQPGSSEEFLRFWFEVSNEKIGDKWIMCSKGGDYRKWYGNQDYVINYGGKGTELLSHKSTTLRSPEKYFQPGIVWTRVTSANPSFRIWPKEYLVSDAGPILFCEDKDKLGLLNSNLSKHLLEALSPTINIQTGDVSSLPNLRSETVAQNVEVILRLSTADYEQSDWCQDFQKPQILVESVDTLEGTYTTHRTHWQSMTDEMQRLEEENNRIFIDAYGLQDELTPEVPIEEITLTCNPAYRYGIKNDAAANEARLRADTMAEFLSYAVGCMFGRYSLDAPGLILANQGERLADYLARIPEPSFMPDEDNVIPVLDADWFPDDITERFRLFLRATFGETHFRENLRYIEDALGKDIRKYFTKDFYTDHVKRYKKRPIYWMFSSPKGTFNALIYMHRYRADTVSVLLNDYLREFVTKLEGERARLEKLSDDPTATQGQKTKALKDASAVAKQIDELNEWERDVIFPLAQQKIEIDLDDGVKANYPKFGTALKKIAGLS
jgi:hypothetical protein